MKNRYYSIPIDAVYAGTVVKVMSGLFRYEHLVAGITERKVDIINYIPYRKIIFVPNEKGLANDLLFDSPNYPVLNVTNDELCLNLDRSSIAVKDAINLGVLLEFAGFNQEVTYRDILTVKKVLFSGRPFDDKTLIKLCATQSDIKYERGYELIKDFLTIMTNRNYTQTQIEELIEQLKVSTSSIKKLSPCSFEEPKVKRLSFLPSEKQY